MEITKVRNVAELQEVCDQVWDQEYHEEFEIKDSNIGDDLIVVGGFSKPIYIQSLGLLVIEGVYMNNNDGIYEADWDLTVIYDWNDKKDEFTQDDVLNYLFFEQDPPTVALHNFCYLKNIPEDIN